MKAQQCECWYHRYHIVHICGCGKLIDHSQGTMDEHRFCEGERETYSSQLYQHGDTPHKLRNRAINNLLIKSLATDILALAEAPSAPKIL